MSEILSKEELIVALQRGKEQFINMIANQKEFIKKLTELNEQIDKLLTQDVITTGEAEAIENTANDLHNKYIGIL